MNCEQTRSLIDGYSDGELDLQTCLALEAHVAVCAGCRAELENRTLLRKRLAEKASYFCAPPGLMREVRSAIRDVSEASSSRAWRWWHIAAPAFAMAIFAMLLLLPQMKETIDAARPEKIVYHIDSNKDNMAALRNVMNHLEASPKARVVVVAHNNGVDFLLQGAKAPDGESYQAEVSKLAARGVDFRVCENTLQRRRLAFSRVIPQAHLVPSGIAEISRLETKEGYAYLKP